MGECSICIYAYSESHRMIAEYVYVYSDGGWVNAQCVYLHIQTVDV